mmetsp:Transcript_1907/g.3307  ORF Transcript_1907/g.3307 Transcript_1907/m.3307 type:complete len:88 (+) Transcript_1907:176-439(+)
MVLKPLVRIVNESHYSEDHFKDGLTLLKNKNFVQILRNVDVETISVQSLAMLEQYVKKNKRFNPVLLKKSSLLACNLCLYQKEILAY